MIVRCQLWSQRMRLGTIEDIGDSLALVRSKGGDVNQRLHLLAPCSRDHGPSISVTRKHDWPRSSLQRTLDRGSILSKRSQGQWSREHPDAFGSQRPDDFGPTRSVSPGTMRQYNIHILTR